MIHKIAALTFFLACAIHNNLAAAVSVGGLQHILLLSHDDDNMRSVAKKYQERKYHNVCCHTHKKCIVASLPRGGCGGNGIQEIDTAPRIRLPKHRDFSKRKVEPPYLRYRHRTAITDISRGGRISRLSQLINKLFNIDASELPQFLSMSTLMFLFIYIFTTARDTKDTLVVSNCGAEAIPFLKLYGVMPCAMLFLVVYSKLSGVLSREWLFYATLVPFFVFYFLFAYVLFPLRDVIHFSSGISSGGGSGRAATSLIHYWSFSLYFIVSELWASAGVPLLFWQCANDVTTLDQAKRFYPLFAVIGNLAPILSGKVMARIVSLQTKNDDVGFGQTLKKIATIKVAICAGIIVLYNTVYVMAGRRQTEVAPPKVTKRKTSLSDSIKELSKSPALRSMAAMVICYNMCIELSEVVWKGLLRKMYPNKSAYMTFMAGFSQKIGAVALVMQLLAPRIICTLGWKWTSLLTPLVMATMIIPFFIAVVVLKGQADWEANSTSGKLVTLTATLAIGTWQIVASKVTKYSLFDPCKEMAYIPLDPELKVKGKAAVEVMGARFGRSLGSLSQQLLVLLVGGGSMINCVPFVGVLYLVTVGFWLRAVCVLAKLFEKSEDDESAADSNGAVKKDL